MTLATAIEILKNARACFGLKSSNKMYSASLADVVTAHDIGEETKSASQGTVDLNTVARNIAAQRGPTMQNHWMATQLQAAGLVAKIKKRNNMAEDSRTDQDNDPEGPRLDKAGTPYKRGEIICGNAARAPNRGGNCDEAADAALYLACQESLNEYQSTYVVGTTGDADHKFCVVNAITRPTWSSVKAMEKADLAIIVIDPWMNLCCFAWLYPGAVQNKFQKWQSVNKRICWDDGPLGSGWYQPLGAYADTFLSSGLVATGAHEED